MKKSNYHIWVFREFPQNKNGAEHCRGTPFSARPTFKHSDLALFYFVADLILAMVGVRRRRRPDQDWVVDDANGHRRRFQRRVMAVDCGRRRPRTLFSSADSFLRFFRVNRVLIDVFFVWFVNLACFLWFKMGCFAKICVEKFWCAFEKKFFFLLILRIIFIYKFV